MLILTAAHRSETTVKKSRFLAEVFPVENQEAARALLKEQKARYPDAAHVVHAFAVGPDGLIQGCSDDGEPSGTAGRPVLEVLKGSNTTNILLTVTRWFGGTLLGTGGLVKAYGEAAKAVLESALTRPLIAEVRFTVTLGYDNHEKLCRALAAHGARDLIEDYGTDVTLSATADASLWPALRDLVTELTGGRCGAALV